MLVAAKDLSVLQGPPEARKLGPCENNLSFWCVRAGLPACFRAACSLYSWCLAIQLIVLEPIDGRQYNGTLSWKQKQPNL